MCDKKRSLLDDFSDMRADRDRLAAENARLEGELVELREKGFKYFLEFRGVETPCPGCNGIGVKTYGNTSTWMGGIGGSAMTNGVCDKCWGSGDENKKWMNLRSVMSQKSALERVTAERGKYHAESLLLASKLNEVTAEMNGAVDDRNDLLNACQKAYQKWHLSDPEIGSSELSDILCNALCNAMGDAGFIAWQNKEQG